MSVTALGTRGGDAVRAVARVVNYLDGRSPERAGRSPEWWDDRDLTDNAPCELGLRPAADGTLAYYADSVEGPGTWMGRGLAGFSPAGEVARAELERMLLGQDPVSGRQFLDGRGSAQRAHQLGRAGVDGPRRRATDHPPDRHPAGRLPPLPAQSGLSHGGGPVCRPAA